MLSCAKFQCLLKSSAPKVATFFFDFSTNPANRKLYNRLCHIVIMAIARLDTGGESAKKMKQHRCNFRTDTEAVSEVIGMVLLLAILVTLFTIIQVSVVPDWNKKVEATEIKVTHDDMMFLPSDIEDVAIHETPKTFTVQLGAHYPDRMIFRNPGPGAFGTLAVEEAPAPINITYNNGSEYTVPFNSARITYEMSGTINSPKLVYEHGVIITDWGTVNLTTDEQKLIENDNIYIPIVNGASSSKSAIGVESLAIKPYEYLDTLGNISSVTVTLDTDYPEVWWGLLEEYIDQGVVSVSNQTKKIDITTDVPYLKLPDQTASGPLHAGMISCSVEDPDGGGGGGDDEGLTGDLEADTDHIFVAGGAAKKNEVYNLSLTNIGGRTITIDYVKTSWVPDGGEGQVRIDINITPVWSAGVGASHASGMWAILTDAEPAKGLLPLKIIEPGAEIKMDFYFVSSDVMTNKDFTIGLLLNDGSVKEVNFST